MIVRIVCMMPNISSIILNDVGSVVDMHIVNAQRALVHGIK